MNVYENAKILAEAFAEEIINSLKDKNKFSIALSGGSTPKEVFKILAVKNFNPANIDIFWGDERCVPPTDTESNFGEADRLWFSKVNADRNYLHRVKGENEPVLEAVRYSGEIKKIVTSDNNIPAFDWIILGLGTDGHTASLFPNAELVIEQNNICGVAVHPVSKQKRLSLTLEVINNAKRISFLAAGSNKAKVIEDIINKKPQSTNYPAAKVNPLKCKTEWFIDKEAAKFIF